MYFKFHAHGIYNQLSSFLTVNKLIIALYFYVLNCGNKTHVTLNLPV